MSIDTRKVARRKLRFENEAEILAEAERLAAGPIRVLGNWSPGRIFKHLAIVMEGSIDGIEFRPPWIIRAVGPWMKGYVLKHGMSPGIKLPENAKRALIDPADVSNEEGLAALRKAIERQLSIAERKPSPVFGKMTRDEWRQLHCRHAELHLSFLTPEG